jgi:response regulator of citrate/malate metabolism
MINVLVVDDDYMVAKVHAGMVAKVPGFAVVGVAHNGEQAIKAVLATQPDLVLLDIYLPDISGIDVLRRLRNEAPDVDVLVVSAATEVDVVRRALRGGVVNYLLKPFDQEALRARLEQYARTSRALAADTVAGQHELDRVFAGGPVRGGGQLPKGLSSETVDLVRRCLRDAGTDLSASECGEVIGLSRVSARRYLEHLVDTGQADVRLRYGAAGRPERRYVWRTPG